MNRLQKTFQKAAAEKRTVLIPYITAGDPDMATTKKTIYALVDAGADIIEIGLPYSDPLADGPTIQRSGQRALAAGTTRQRVFDLIAEVRAEGVEVPVVLLVYYNCIYKHGETRFVQEAAAAGADGIVTPDLPPEEAQSLRGAAQEANLSLIPLVAPTSTDARLQFIGTVASGFIYCVSVTGVTGARGNLAHDLSAFIARVREQTGDRLPLAIGFGISDGEQARTAAALAEGVIVGSALIEAMEQEGTPQQAVAAGGQFMRALRDALDAPIGDKPEAG